MTATYRERNIEHTACSFRENTPCLCCCNLEYACKTCDVEFLINNLHLIYAQEDYGRICWGGNILAKFINDIEKPKWLTLHLEHLPDGVLVTCLERRYFVQLFEILYLHWSFNIVLFLLFYYVGPNVIETSVARTDLNNSIKVRVDK